MFFVFGSPRSGTTLLAASLDLHDSIVVPDETDFIIPAAFVFDRVKDELTGKTILKRLIPSTARFPGSLGNFLTVEEVAEIIDASPYSCAAVLQNLYGRLAKKAGKRLAGDKSPNDLGQVGMLIQTQVFAADIKVLHIVRDVRDQLVSLIKTGWTSEPEAFPQAWSNSNTRLAEYFQGRPQQYLLITYERLASDPRTELAKATEFLGAPFQEQMLDASARGAKYAGVAHHANLGNAINLKSVGRWKTELPPALLERCRTRAAPGMEYFGYR